MVEDQDGQRPAPHAPGAGHLEGTPRTVLPQGIIEAEELGAEQIAGALRSGPLHKVPMRQVFPILLAQFTMAIAAITPTAYSLAVWMARIAPERKDSLLSLAVGIPSVLTMVVQPLVNVLSDRTRSRLGRRRTWLIVGIAAGTVGSVLIVAVPSVVAVIGGWAIACTGYGIVSGMVIVHFSDRLPESQRGQVMGIAGAVTQVAPLLGVMIAGALSSVPPAIFLGPAALALIGTGVLVAVMKDPQYTGARAPIDIRQLAQGYWFNPRRLPNMGWVWLNTFFLYLAMAFMTLYSVYLLSSRLGLDSGQIATVVASAGVIGSITGIGGAVGAGVLSDRLQSRKLFLVLAAAVLAAGLVVIGTSESVVQYLIGTALTAGAAGIYGAVNQAVQLDVLPAGEDQNGRYLAVLGLAQQVPQAVGPLLAGVVLAMAGGQYGWVYFAAAILAIPSMLTVIPMKLGHRRGKVAGPALVAVDAD